MAFTDTQNHLTCDHCNSEEGQIRLIGNYIVVLSEVSDDGKTRLLCQSCKIKHRNMELVKQKLSNRKKSRLNWIKRLLDIG